jgi:hypothetical protein
MVRMRSMAVFFLLLPAGATAAEKTWHGRISHPPILGEAFGGASVGLGSVSGRCAREFGALLRQDLIAHGVNIVPTSGARVDNVSVEITRCEARQREPILGPGLPAIHISRTEGLFEGELRVTNASTGRTVIALPLRAEDFKENYSQTGSPEYPSGGELTDRVVRQGIEQSRRLHTKWTEDREIIFLEEKGCDFEDSWNRLQAGDFHGLVRAARANAESCHAARKATAAAWYDLGIAHVLVQNYDGALSTFAKALQLRDIRHVSALVAICQRSKTNAAVTAAQVMSWIAGSQTGAMLSNDIVALLVRGGVPESEILKLIGSQPNRFAVGANDVAELRDAGVPDSIVAAMESRKTR